MTVKRYRVTGGTHETHADGEYVLFWDYEVIQEQLRICAAHARSLEQHLKANGLSIERSES